jgi:clan AA aspartic protease (TIGR02281 family)
LFNRLINLRLLCLATLCLASASIAAAPQAADGVKLYKKGDYVNAAKVFDASIRAGTADANSVYYAAISHEQLHEFEKAKALYEVLIRKYPQEPAADLAEKAMARPEFQLACDGFSPKFRDISHDVLPKECYVNFTDNRGAMMVSATINGRPTKVCFDTGAATCVISVDHAREFGIQIPTRPPDLSVSGYGSTEHIPGWRVKVDLTVGRIVRPNFSVFLSTAHLPFPMLGATFYHEFQYTIDKSSSSIAFKRNTPATAGAGNQQSNKTMTTLNASGKYEYSVPFVMDGQQLVVTAKVNGVDCPMQFDTGAGMCMFTNQQFRSVGGGTDTGHSITINGAGGAAESKIYTVRSIQMGPLNKSVDVAVSDTVRAKYPLLGQNFFGDLHYTIDHGNLVIRFEK